jgi:hypothetical protein
MEELKKPNAQLYLYLAAVEGANGVEVSENFRKYFTEYSPPKALSIICLKLQDDRIAIGSKKYASVEELTQEKDSSQIGLIKKALMETDSLLLVWLSFLHKDKLPTSDAFIKQPVSGKLFLLGLLPYCVFKEMDPQGWQTNAAEILKGLIDTHPGRADLFEAYAAQGFPLNDEMLVEDRCIFTPLDYILHCEDYSPSQDTLEDEIILEELLEEERKDGTLFQGKLSVRHGRDTIENLIFLIHKLGDIHPEAYYLKGPIHAGNVSLIKRYLALGTDVNEYPNIIAEAAWYGDDDLSMVKLLLDSGATKKTIQASSKAVSKWKISNNSSKSKDFQKEVFRLLKEAERGKK